MLAILPLLFFVIFMYIPMYGVIIAFKDFRPALGILESDWVGFQNFVDFVTSTFFTRLLNNTLLISISSLVFGFPIPIVFALLINELRNKYFVKTVQTITYLPHFISLVVICGMIKMFTSDVGFISLITSFFTGSQETLLNVPKAFVPIFVTSGIWQEFGWGSIIYLAVLAGLDQELYEAAKIDGAGRWRQTINITIPGLMPTIIIMLILRLGNLLSVGFEKIILLYNPGIYETSDVISSFVYRRGLIESDWSFSTAVGLFNSVINLILLITANKISRSVNETSLW
jgi:putative aldouronate transport system permease protein